MASDPLRVLDTLSPAELSALLSAAAWYAKYHDAMIAKLSDDRSAFAMAKKERFTDLHGALRKLGVPLRLPAGISLLDR